MFSRLISCDKSARSGFLGWIVFHCKYVQLSQWTLRLSVCLVVMTQNADLSSKNSFPLHVCLEIGLLLNRISYIFTCGLFRMIIATAALVQLSLVWNSFCPFTFNPFVLKATYSWISRPLFKIHLGLSFDRRMWSI